MIRKPGNGKLLIPTMAAIALLAAATGFYLSLQQAKQIKTADPGLAGLFWPEPKPLHEFSVIDQNANTFGLNQLYNKWSFIFFGYTHCPDICPITLSVMADAYGDLSTEFTDIQTVFVSVDPDRDTPERLAEYVAYFDKNFIGLGGDLSGINSLTEQIGIAFFYKRESNPKNYLVDHSASIFLIDPKARLVGKLSPPHNKEKIIEHFSRIRDFINAQS